MIMMALSCDILSRNSLKQIMELPLHLDNLKSEFHNNNNTLFTFVHLQIFIIEDRKYTPRNRNKRRTIG